jgi:phosphatidylinositol alpha 1,6-mannosyltransferase
MELKDRQVPGGGSRPLRVAYFAGSLRPGHDGVTRVLYRLMESLPENNVDAVFFSPLVPPASFQSPFPIHRVPSVAFPCYSDYRVALPGHAYFQHAVREFMPDLLHINSPCSLGAAAVHYGDRHGIPVVATYHTHFSSYAKYYSLKALEPAGWKYFRSLYNRCALTFVPSLPILRDLEARGFKNLEFLPHGVDTARFNPGFRDEQWRRSIGCPEKKILLFVSRLVWEKDLRTLMEMYRLLTSRRSDWELVVVGDGPAKVEVERGMPEARFPGHLSGGELSTAYASCDVFVFPSTTETFGNVTLEAMASGIVPVCVSEGGASGVVTEGMNGFIVPPRDPHNLARRVEFLLDHPDRREEMGTRAREYARTQTWDVIFRRLFDKCRAIVRAAALRREKPWSNAA